MNQFWQTCVALFLIGFLVAGIIYYIAKPSYPIIVNIYQGCYNQMSEQENKDRLIDYARAVMHDPIDGLNYTELLEWEHTYLLYPSENYTEAWKIKVQLEGRLEEPVEILASKFKVALYHHHSGKIDIKAMGKCGEFSLLYVGLCLANNIPVRLVIDCSIKTDNRTTGDHVWAEVLVNGNWLHVDPTENKINQPYLYRDGWNKNVNLVYAIEETGIIDVTESYK